MKKLVVTIVLGATLTSAPVLAQGLGVGHDQTRAQAQQRADMLFQMLDGNHDGVVTRAEAQHAAAQFEAQRASDNGRGGGRIQRMLDQLFSAGDSLTLQQFEARGLARFDAQDLNHDGVVTAAERQQLREQRAQVQPRAAVPAQPQPQ